MSFTLGFGYTVLGVLAGLAAMAVTASGCSTAPAEEADVQLGSDESEYVVWQRSASCLVKKSLAPSIKICVTGWGDLARSRALTENALRQWLDAVRPLNANVTSTIVFGCDAPDGRVHVDNRGEFSMPADVYLNSNSAQGTYIHEFGHAFACLGDTYVGGTAGACMYGQPHSVMCDGLLRNDLSADDIAGAQAQFRALVGGGPPPPPANPDDLDGDGIANADDLCPNTPSGSHIWKDQLGGVWKGCAYGQTRTRR